MSLSKDDSLLIDRPLELAERLFGPDKNVPGQWVVFREGAAPRFIREELLEVDPDDALEIEGELCS